MTIDTSTKPTWCPGCFNFPILAGVKKVLKTKDPKSFAIVTGIGCHAKMFDYINLNGINTLHGRVVPTMLGIKVGNPNLNVIGFSGDGDAYAEGISHLVHAARYNSDINYFVHTWSFICSRLEGIKGRSFSGLFCRWQGFCPPGIE